MSDETDWAFDPKFPASDSAGECAPDVAEVVVDDE